jgi:phage FluMu protein gp41
MQSATGKFVRGMQIGGVTYTGFEMREADTGDMMDAELEAAKQGGGVETPIIFNAQMMLRQLVKVTSDDGQEFNGPFTTNMLKKLKPIDYRALRNKQVEIDALGEAV